MRILHVITSLYTGGAEKLILDIVPKLGDMGNEVDVCIFNGNDSPFKRELQKCGCNIYCFSQRLYFYNPIYIIRLCNLMRKYDIVHTHNTSPQFFAAIAAKVLCSVVLVTTEHTTSNRRRDWKWYPKFIDRWMYNQYKKVICISDQAKINLMNYIGHTKADVCTIYNGVDIDRYHNAKSKPELRSKLGKFVIVMVAGFRYQKDQDTLIKSMTCLNNNDYELWLVGDGVRRAELEKLVISLNIEEQVKFFGVRTDVPEILHTADVVVMSSHFEGLSLSNIEGMSVGKPFVASDVDGLHEITQDYGILFPHQDYKALAKIIEELRANNDYYKKVADKCYERAKQYDITKMVSEYQKVYEEVIR